MLPLSQSLSLSHSQKVEEVRKKKVEMAMRHNGLSVLGYLLCAGALASPWLPSVAADSAAPFWHPDPARPDDHGTPAVHHDALPPLSAPPPTAGADLPHFGFPLQPTFGSAAAPVGGEGYPFIGSSPTVPLPTGVTDTATVRDPMPGTANKVAGHAAASVPLHNTIIAPLASFFFSLLFFSSSTP